MARRKRSSRDYHHEPPLGALSSNRFRSAYEAIWDLVLPPSAQTERSVRLRETEVLGLLSKPAPPLSDSSYLSLLNGLTPAAVQAVGGSIHRFASSVMAPWMGTEVTSDADVGEPLPSQLVSARSVSSESSALLRLPPEIRILIWRYAVGDRFVFTPSTQCPGKRGHYLPKWPVDSHLPQRIVMKSPEDPSHYLSTNWQLLTSQGVPLRDGTQWCPMWFPKDRRLRPSRATPQCRRDLCYWSGFELIRVCKFIHAEALPILMSRNTFHFRAAYEYAHFRQQVGSRRLAFIRHLWLRHIPVSADIRTISTRGGCVVRREPRPVAMIDPRTWVALWACIAADMPLLRELDVEVVFYHRDRTTFRSSWLDDLRGLAGRLRRAQIWISCPYHSWEAGDFEQPRQGRESWYTMQAKAREIERFLVKGRDVDDEADASSEADEHTTV